MFGDNMSEISENMNKLNKTLSSYACKNEDAIRFEPIKPDIRTDFFRDADKILYSLAYTRYIDKTQVFSNNENDMISRRMTHVQLVSKIARTIGRALNLNEDLIEAASLGHDLGHTPFGHVGESILSKLSMKYDGTYFNHNVQSVRELMRLENAGKGLNITVQVLDAIFSHNGEMLNPIYEPVSKTKEEFLREYEESYKDQSILKKVRPMTLEGCVVRISDVISYIGKDIDDAVRLGKLDRNSVPKEITDVLGHTNGEIVDTIVMDIITNSIGKKYIKMSDEVFTALKQLMAFNYTNIYMRANTKEDIELLQTKFEKLFELYYSQLSENKSKEDIFTIYLDTMCSEYIENTSYARIVIDYIAGMTDDFFNNQYKRYFK